MPNSTNQTSPDKKIVRGLEGVVAAETNISFVDGDNGDLFYQGYHIHQLAEKISYDEAVYLLWYGDLPTKKQLQELREKMIPEMTVPKAVGDWIAHAPKNAFPMDVLRTAVSMLAFTDADEHDNSADANLRKAIRLTAKVPAIVAAMNRSRHGDKLSGPDLKKSLAHNFMDMFSGKKVDKQAVKVAEMLFILHADHGMNASTFAARVTASTCADIYAAITSAIGSLKGPLHGGANEKVMEMLESIGDPEAAEDYIVSLLSSGKKIMGFGHRVYKVEDPRATILRKWAKKLCEERHNEVLFEISKRVEKKVVGMKHIPPNVDFYSALVQHAIDIPKEFYTTLFAAARVSGWTAHVMEQHKDNRLIRPTSKYTGQYGRRFVTLARRHVQKHEEIAPASVDVPSSD